MVTVHHGQYANNHNDFDCLCRQPSNQAIAACNQRANHMLITYVRLEQVEQ